MIEGESLILRRWTGSEAIGTEQGASGSAQAYVRESVVLDKNNIVLELGRALAKARESIVLKIRYGLAFLERFRVSEIRLKHVNRLKRLEHPRLGTG